jgi:hypothetical protein
MNRWVFQKQSILQLGFRNTGLLGCIELVKNRITKEPMTTKPVLIMNKVNKN